MRKKDAFHVSNQDQLGLALAALGTVMNTVFQDKVLAKTVLPPIADTAQILLDLHHKMSGGRRYQITPGLSKIAKEVGESNQIDTHLFGMDFG